ncbi:MAG TPA: hypothetical protein VJ867_06385 [Gemmatimonadaceae bacterium]|nr:hypothetical protein [Gemmatimonadaceae bacterium]
MSHHRVRLVALCALVLVTTPPIFGSDKAKHFLMSFLMQSTGYSLGRTFGLNRASSQVVGGAGVAAVGIAKELHDRKVGKGFSLADLAWDAAGGVAAASLLNGAR